uniref:Ovule protein n=1 Tax=Schistosoma mansoni TaxID=6183 RepID=A0A5K4FAZ6_SCHMA
MTVELCYSTTKDVISHYPKDFWFKFNIDLKDLHVIKCDFTWKVRRLSSSWTEEHWCLIAQF